MPTRRETALGLMTGAVALALARGRAEAQPLPEAEATAVVAAWLEALRSGDPAVVTKVLAPEFQIARSDGSGFDKEGYLANLPKQTSVAVLSGVTATGTATTMVVRYAAEIEQTINDQPVQAKAPRLSAFRKEGDAWLIVAHANFARIG